MLLFVVMLLIGYVSWCCCMLSSFAVRILGVFDASHCCLLLVVRVVGCLLFLLFVVVVVR